MSLRCRFRRVFCLHFRSVKCVSHSFKARCVSVAIKFILNVFNCSTIEMSSKRSNTSSNGPTGIKKPKNQLTIADAFKFSANQGKFQFQYQSYQRNFMRNLCSSLQKTILIVQLRVNSSVFSFDQYTT